MPRLSNKALKALYAVQTDAVLITLLTVHLSDSDGTVRLERLTDAGSTVVSRSHSYQALPMRLSLPSDTDAGAPRARLEIANVSREIAVALRAADRASADIELVFSTAPDVVEIAWRGIHLTEAAWDAAQVSVALGYQATHQEPYPAPRFTPETTPGAF